MRKRSAICILSLMLAFSTVLFAACGNGDDNVSEEPLPNQLEFTFEDYTFGETASTPVVTKTPFDNAAITYTYEGRNETEYAESNTAPVNAGEYTITGTAAATDAYKSAEYSVNFTVEKAENQLQFTFADYNYGAAASLPAITKAPNEDAAVSYVYKGRNDTVYAESATAPTDIGEYTVTGTATATANYNAATYSVDFSVTRAGAAANEIEFFDANGTDSQIKAAGVTATEWLPSFEGESGVIKLDFSERAIVAFDIKPRKTLAEYQETGLARVYLKLYVAPETTGLTSINIMNDGTNTKAFAMGQWQIISFSAKHFENNFDLFANDVVDNGFMIKGTTATGTIYISEFGYVPASEGEVENFDDEYSLAGTQTNTSVKGALVVDEYKGEKGVLKLSFSARNLFVFDVTPRFTKSVYENGEFTKISMKVFVPEETTGVTSVQLNGKQKTITAQGEWLVLEWDIADFISRYDELFADDKSNNAFWVNGTSATGDIYIASISVS